MYAGTTAVDNTLWTTSNVFRMEYIPTHEAAGGGTAGYVHWSLNGKPLVTIDAHALRQVCPASVERGVS
eukprot:COSAG01_NODE_7041_length_3380_cov_6.993600_2_plen_69_part_00